MDITAPSEVERQISNEAENPVSEDYDTGHSTVEVGLHRDELHDGTDVLQQDRLEMQSHGTVEEKVVVPSMVSHREDIICETLEHTEQSHEDVKGDSRLFVCCNKINIFFLRKQKATNHF